MHTCQTTNCHTGSPLSAGLDLSNDNLLNAQVSYLDVPSRGDPTGTPPACAPGTAKLIDSSDPLKSLIYAKLRAPGEPLTVPCGSKMPFVGQITADEKACILTWIQSVVAVK
jgi:hypothetical protein